MDWTGPDRIGSGRYFDGVWMDGADVSPPSETKIHIIRVWSFGDRVVRGAVSVLLCNFAG
jgi:hypothetical protein